MLKLFWILLLVISFSPNSEARFSAEISINNAIQNQRVIEVHPEALNWKIRILYTDTTKQVRTFKMSHMKPMHMLIVKDDHSKISHIHPTLDMMKAEFSITMNSPSDDPDNQDLAQALIEPGDYTIYMEVVPEEGPSQPVPDLITQRVRVLGQWHAEKLFKDPVAHDGVITKHFNDANIEGQFGDKYQVELRQQVTMGCNGNFIQLFVSIYEWKSRTIMNDTIEGYFEVVDIQPWLMMDGHALILPDIQNHKKPLYEHLHTMRTSYNNILEFTLFEKPGRLSKNLSKIYVQLRHQDKVRTFNFVVDKSYFNPTTNHCTE